MVLTDTIGGIDQKRLDRVARRESRNTAPSVNLYVTKDNGLPCARYVCFGALGPETCNVAECVGTE